MVQINQTPGILTDKYDMSFMYTKACNITCPFCMYNSGPDVHDALDLRALEEFLYTVNFDKIASYGFYGGEPSIEMDGFDRTLALLLLFAEKPRFVITNGAWSRSKDETDAFITWAKRCQFHVVVSGTPFHRKYQDRAVLDAIKAEYPKAITLKPSDENFIPMGRLAGKLQKSCTKKCMWWQGQPLRIAVQPDGTIIFQNCDGSYPVVGTIREPFDVLDARIQEMRRAGFQPVCPLWPAENTAEQCGK